MIFDEIVFGNSFRNGDIHVSRKFVKEIIKEIPAKSYSYYQTDMSCHEILKDIDKLQVKHGHVDSGRGIYIDNNRLFISTWYASCNYKYFSTGCSIVTLFNYFRGELNSLLGSDIIKNDIGMYLPEIDFKILDQDTKKSIDTFTENNKSIVLICDNSPASGQGHHVDFRSFLPIINKYPKIMFVTTNNTFSGPSNLINFTELSKNYFTLNEISYLSNKCNVLVGRCSGPHTFCLTKPNILDVNKTFISFINLKEHDFGLKSTNLKTFKMYNYPAVNNEEEISNIIGNYNV
jgi:hypothetical protein